MLFVEMALLPPRRPASNDLNFMWPRWVLPNFRAHYNDEIKQSHELKIKPANVGAVTGFTLWTCMCEGSAESKHFSERTSWLLCSMFSFMTGKCQYVLYMLGTFSMRFLWRRFTFSAQETLQFIFIGCESSRHPRDSQVCSSSRKVSAVTRQRLETHSRVIDGPVHADDRYFQKPNIINAQLLTL